MICLVQGVVGSVLYINRNLVAMKAAGKMPPSWGWIVGMNIIGIGPAPAMHCNDSKHGASSGSAPPLKTDDAIQLYPHINDPFANPWQQRAWTKPPSSWSSSLPHFSGYRGSLNGSQLDQYNSTGLGDVVWSTWRVLDPGSLDQLRLQLKEVARRGLWLFDLAGYIPGTPDDCHVNSTDPLAVSSLCEYHIPQPVQDILNETLGERFAGMDNGEQDGRYLDFAPMQYRGRGGGERARRSELRQGFLYFMKYFDRMADDLGNRLTSLSSLWNPHYFARTAGAENASMRPGVLFVAARPALDEWDYGRPGQFDSRISAPPPPWKCVRTSGGREGCLRNANHTWTGGHNKNYSGCLTCFCCEPEGDLPTPEPTGILNFHAPLQNYPTSQEAALLALLRIGRSTNGATRGKIPCPWLVLDASLPNKFEGLNSAEDAEFQEVMLLERMLRQIKSDDKAAFAGTTTAGVPVVPPLSVVAVPSLSQY